MLVVGPVLNVFVTFINNGASNVTALLFQVCVIVSALLLVVIVPPAIVT